MTAAVPAPDAPLPRRSLLDAAEDIGQQARDAYGLTGPLEGAAWCRRAGVELTWRAQNEEGRYTRHDSRALISMRQGDHGLRTNFTLAHELGHHFVEQSRRDPAFRSRLRPATVRLLGRIGPASPAEEPLCDVLAGVLLIEADDAMSALPDGRPDVDALLALSKRCHVSPAAAFVRLTQLAAFDAVLVGRAGPAAAWQIKASHGSGWHLGRLRDVLAAAECNASSPKNTASRDARGTALAAQTRPRRGGAVTLLVVVVPPGSETVPATG